MSEIGERGRDTLAQHPLSGHSNPLEVRLGYDVDPGSERLRVKCRRRRIQTLVNARERKTY